jgi:hypothetical protein
MATTTPNFGWSVPTSTDLVKDGATAIELLGDSIDTSLVDLKGGTTGQVLSKTSNTDMDFTWIAADPLLILDAKGDLISATAADTPARLAVGANGTVLTADSTESTGLKWAAPASGGKVLQVVSTTYSTSKTIASTSLTDTDLTLSITPTLATSKVLVLLTQNYWLSSSSSTNSGMAMVLDRGGASVFDMDQNGYSTRYVEIGNATSVGDISYFSMQYLDSPATTSSTTYKTRARVYSTAAGRQVIMNSNSSPATMILMEIGA